MLWESSCSPGKESRIGCGNRNSQGNQRWCPIWGFQKERWAEDSVLEVWSRSHSQMHYGREDAVAQQAVGRSHRCSSGHHVLVHKERELPVPECPRGRASMWCFPTHQHMKPTERDLVVLCRPHKWPPCLVDYFISLQNYSPSKARKLPVWKSSAQVIYPAQESEDATGVSPRSY